MNTRLKDTLIGLPVIVVIVIAAVYAVSSWGSLPVVHESYQTGQCVKVVDPTGNHSCAKLPDRYHHVWVR